LRQRPDLLANVAKLRASDAEITAARSALFPKVSLSANVQGNIGQLSVNGSPYFPVEKPQGAALLTLPRVDHTTPSIRYYDRSDCTISDWGRPGFSRFSAKKSVSFAQLRCADSCVRGV